MIYIFIELGSYRQVMRLRAKTVDGIVGNLKGLVEYNGGSCEFSENGVLLFSIDPLEVRKERSIELIHHAFAVLLEGRRELQGFVVVAEQYANSLSATTFPVLGQLRRAAAGVDRDESLWLGRKLWDLLGDGFIGEERGDLVRIVERIVEGPQSADDAVRFFVRPHLVEEIEQAIEERLASKGPNGWIRIRASEASGVRANIRQCLTERTHGKDFGDWVYLGAGRDSLSALEPFLESIRPEFLTVVPDYLSKSDRMLWEQRIGILDFTCPDHISDDFFSIYSLYLLAYARYMKRHRLPPVVVCPDADRYPAASLRFLVRLLSRFENYGRLVPICTTTGEERLGELEALPHRTIVVGALEASEINERVSGFSRLAETDQRRLADTTEGQALYLYHACLVGKLANTKGVQISMELLRQRDIAARSILYATYLTDGILDREQIASFLVESGVAEEVYKRELSSLVQLGFIDEGSTRLEMPEIGHLLAGEVQAKELDRQLADFCYAQWQSDKLSVTQPAPANPERISRLFWFLSRNGRFDQALPVFLAAMNRLLDQRMVDDALHYLEQENLFRMNLSAEETRRRDFFIELTALRAAVLLGAREQADLRLVRLKEMQLAGDWEKGLLDLLSAQHHYAAFETKLALDAAKRSLISAQAVESGLLECKADIEIGLTMLANARFEEAEEYFALARGAVPARSAEFDHIRALAFESITLFLFGNISKSLKLAEEAGGRAAAAGRREWQRLSLLLRGRCYFALGMYEEALKVFQAGSSFCRIYPNDPAGKVFSAWGARSVAYGGGGNSAKFFEGLERDGEVLLFLSESSAEAGGYDRAAELAAESLEQQSERAVEYAPGESVPWTSGFAPIEDRAFRKPDGKGVLYYRTKAIQAYLKGMRAEVDEAVAEFTRLAREERLSEHDPNNCYYYYLHSRIVPHGEGELLVDRLTVLSKALKYLQERATRIDDVKKRQSYLRQSLWNARLMEDARQLKLT